MSDNRTEAGLKARRTGANVLLFNGSYYLFLGADKDQAIASLKDLKYNRMTVWKETGEHFYNEHIE